MTARPILFNDEMVRAILSGRKTQTRRPVKPQPMTHMGSTGLQFDHRGWSVSVSAAQYAGHCRNAQPGDRLWVRECFAPLGDILTEIVGRPRVYRADADLVRDDSGDRDGWWLGETFIEGAKRPFAWTPSIHMPRWASRLTLLVADVRVERLQDISEADALAEGVSGWVHDERCETARDGFRVLWSDTYGPASWTANPWVWAISFEKETP